MKHQMRKDKNTKQSPSLNVSENLGSIMSDKMGRREVIEDKESPTKIILENVERPNIQLKAPSDFSSVQEQKVQSPICRLRFDDGESDGNVTISTEMAKPNTKNIPNMSLGLQVSAMKP